MLAWIFRRLGWLLLSRAYATCLERGIFIDNLLVRVDLIIAMTWWTGLAAREFESPFPGSLSSTVLVTCLNKHMNDAYPLLRAKVALQKVRFSFGTLFLILIVNFLTDSCKSF